MKHALMLAAILAACPPAFAGTTTLQAVDGRFTPRVVLNGQLHVQGLIDLGATTVVVCDHMAAALDLPRGDSVVLETVAQRLTAHRTMVKSIRFGRTEVRNVRAVILPDHLCGEVLIGMSLLARLDVVTLEGEKLTLSNVDEAREHQPRRRSRRR
jgi:clan AA aspartic protease (TIGR02281 family)